MKPEELNPLEISARETYGNKEIFEKKLVGGFTTVAFGGGEWVDRERLVRLWVFYGHPQKKIATYEHRKLLTGPAHSIHLKPFEAEYNDESFRIYCKLKKIELGKGTDLKQITEDWKQ